jgi:hypothetical protein
MNHRHHLFIDSLGQILILLFFGYLYSLKNDSNVVLKLIPIVLCFWQLINGILSYKFFERLSKKIYVRTAGITIATIFALNGFIWFSHKIIPLNQSVYSAFENIKSTFEVITIILCTLFCLWYIVLTVREIYIVLFRTI